MSVKLLSAIYKMPSVFWDATGLKVLLLNVVQVKFPANLSLLARDEIESLTRYQGDFERIGRVGDCVVEVFFECGGYGFHSV